MQPGQPEGRPLLIGWKEYLSFPEWHIRRLRVKIDTGARTSALDVRSYELVQREGCAPLVRLHLALSRKHPERRRVIETPVLGMVIVSSSVGMCEERPLVETAVQFGPVRKRIRLTVTNGSFSTPDGGATFALLGSALMGLGILRRKFQA